MSNSATRITNPVLDLNRGSQMVTKYLSDFSWFIKETFSTEIISKFGFLGRLCGNLNNKYFLLDSFYTLKCLYSGICFIDHCRILTGEKLPWGRTDQKRPSPVFDWGRKSSKVPIKKVMVGNWREIRGSSSALKDRRGPFRVCTGTRELFTCQYCLYVWIGKKTFLVFFFSHNLGIILLLKLFWARDGKLLI